MSTLVLQILISQWDKGQQSEQHRAARTVLPDRYLISRPKVIELLGNRLVIDQHGDDLLGNRISYALTDDSQFGVDRFRICLKRKTLEYLGAQKSNTCPRLIGSLEDNWIQCQYDWRYSVYEGGFYYWLYEKITLNALWTDDFCDTAFMQSEPTVICKDLA